MGIPETVRVPGISKLCNGETGCDRVKYVNQVLSWNPGRDTPGNRSAYNLSCSSTMYPSGRVNFPYRMENCDSSEDV